METVRNNHSNRRDRRRRTAAAAAVGASVAVAFGATASLAEPAPPGQSSAVAAEVKGILGVGRTNATAGENNGEATANALEVGTTVVAGGTQKGTGKKSGALFDTNTTPLGRLQLAPWAAEALAGPESSSASSKAALLRLMLVNSNVVDVNVLQSESSATWSAEKSTSKSSSDGATANVGGANGLMLVLLHSEANSEGKGSSYVASANGTKVLTSDQAGTGCAVSVPNVASLNCLSASGGNGVSAAQVGGANVGGASGLTANLLSAQGKSGTGTEEAARVLAGQVEAPDTGDETGRALAFTGSRTWFWSVLGAAVLALGAALRSLRRAIPASSR